MNRKEEPNHNETDLVLQELWEAKDYYSLSCNSDFDVLVRKVREDIKAIVGADSYDDASKMAASS